MPRPDSNYHASYHFDRARARPTVWRAPTAGRRPTEQVLKILEHGATAISLAGVAVIVAGFLYAAGRYAGDLFGTDLPEAFKNFKIRLAGALMLGLEILVVADVIDTIVTKPTYGSLAFLAALVALRTIVSWTLFLEVNGRWPWQAGAEG